MTTYVVRRLLEALGVIVAVTFVVFALLHLTGDPVRLMLPPEAPPRPVQQPIRFEIEPPQDSGERKRR